MGSNPTGAKTKAIALFTSGIKAIAATFPSETLTKNKGIAPSNGYTLPVQVRKI